MRKILVLGGYGGFGARLSRRLAGDGFEVLVTGRNLEAAKALASRLPNAIGLQADRNGDIAAILDNHKPFLLIDAAGPFQHSDDRVVRACIKAGIHYIDLADARDFVGSIGSLDEQAKAASVTVISGASSVPALSTAVVAELSKDMQAVRSIEISISASNRATAGASVASAILSYVGKPVRLWRGRRWQNATGWHMLKRENYVVAGHRPLRRLVALADVPDHDLLVEGIAGRPSVVFRAGPEFTFQTLALWLLSWLVAWGWLASLGNISRSLLPLQGLTARFGTARSAVTIEAKGIAQGIMRARRWTLIAENGDGAEIPTLPAQLLARALRDGRLLPGARHAGGLLSLEDFRTLFRDLAISEETTETSYKPLYLRIMGPAFAHLAKSVRAMHEVFGDGGAKGEAIVTRGHSPVTRLVARVFGFPAAGKHALHVSFKERDGIEQWTRDFSGQRFRSHLSDENGHLVERFGPFRFSFDLPMRDNGFCMEIRRWSFLRLPLPLFLAPQSVAHEWAEDGRFQFDVPIALPFIGLVVHYRGWLEPID
ncbi:SDR family oxidoreductase [Rhizobium hainanense]|uniref:Saccharopine dehydrogenase, NADP-dependent n=1 Tax=Rhizobium hainanense TaxID=52131 RepID=A0A1C3W7T0_9HYPH|nr:SDR family oxidoreductase [Rhizobium hainanense]SCB35774.1 Saccharopine dehydrogenase, NADP-dependent [Rhizobium hainanense]